MRNSSRSPRRLLTLAAMPFALVIVIFAWSGTPEVNAEHAAGELLSLINIPELPVVRADAGASALAFAGAGGESASAESLKRRPAPPDEPASSQHGELCGIVTNESREPLAQVSLQLFILNDSGMTFVSKCQTDADGRYLLTLSSQQSSLGSGVIVARKRGLATTSLVIPDPPGCSRRPLGMFMMARPVCVSGKIVDAAGNPVANATIQPGDQLYTSAQLQFRSEGAPVRSNADGRFDISQFARGSAHVIVTASGFQSQALELNIPASAGPELFVQLQREEPAASSATRAKTTDPAGRNPREDSHALSLRCILECRDEPLNVPPIHENPEALRILINYGSGQPFVEISKSNIQVNNNNCIVVSPLSGCPHEIRAIYENTWFASAISFENCVPGKTTHCRDLNLTRSNLRAVRIHNKNELANAGFLVTPDRYTVGGCGVRWRPDCNGNIRIPKYMKNSRQRGRHWIDGSGVFDINKYLASDLTDLDIEMPSGMQYSQSVARYGIQSISEIEVPSHATIRGIITYNGRIPPRPVALCAIGGRNAPAVYTYANPDGSFEFPALVPGAREILYEMSEAVTAVQLPAMVATGFREVSGRELLHDVRAGDNLNIQIDIHNDPESTAETGER